MCPSLNEAGEFNSLNEYACLRERECVYVRGTEKERERESVSVCVRVSWNGVEEPGRGTGLRVRERIRNYSSSLHELHDKYMSYRNT